jgi:hypothetical protein
MQNIFDLKGQTVTDTPLLVFDCTLANGQFESWSTHAITAGNTSYSPRVLTHTIFEIQTASDQGVDGIPRISIVLANADSHFSEIQRSIGWKGAKLKVGLLFYDLRNGVPLTDTSVIFQGICNPPEEIREATFRLSATNRMNLQRLVLPQVRIQKRCPWEFPATQAQRIEAIDGGTAGKYSRYYRCGYSAGEQGGSGTLNGASPYTSCGHTRGDCQARGMAPNFGGIEFVPPAISVRTYGDSSFHTSAISVNDAQYNDFVPLVYGTAWYKAPVVFARNDGNLTHMEVLLGVGEFQGVLTVLVNDVEIPQGVAGTNMTGTGWYNIPTLGTRSGTSNPDFTDSSGHPLGDPYGSMAYLSVVVPNRLNNGTTLPTVKVLAQGLKLPVYQISTPAQGQSPGIISVGEQFTSNPVWILLDVLRRTGWGLDEIDLTSVINAAVYCDQPINALDIYGNAVSLARFQCNLALVSKRAGGDLVRGIRNSARLLLTYGPNGALQVRVENTIAAEVPTKPAWSNSSETLNGGWPSYEFGDGTNSGAGAFSGILRKPSGEPSVSVSSRRVADTPNRWVVEFQDALNGYQQDSFALVDADDVQLCGQEVSATLTALGIANYDQAARILKVNLDKSVRGNTYVEFQTSVMAFGIQAGDLITLTYSKEGWLRQPFRITKLAPGLNHRVVTISGQIHDDAWYADSNGQVSSAAAAGPQGNATQAIPKPLMGAVTDTNGNVQLGISEVDAVNSDGTAAATLTVSFIPPVPARQAGPGIPLVSLAAQLGMGGNLQGGQTLYYAISAVDSSGNESGLSFVVRAVTAANGSSVTLTGFGFAPGTAAFNVYRGPTPAQMARIASNETIATTFTDTGLPPQLIAPPDGSYDYANFYWRMELEPEIAVSLHSATTVGNGTLQMQANQWRGMTAWISRGRGAGQERAIVTNSTTTLTISPAWDVEPDATSFFAVAENSWRFGALSANSPAEFEVPNRAGQTVQISGRSANANDEECALEISPITRWQIGGSQGTGDAGVPATPTFGLGASAGTLELSGVSFSDLTNTRTVSSATMTFHYWDELDAATPTLLTSAVAATDTVISVAPAATLAVGSFVQLGAEVMQVSAVSGGQITITRARFGTTAAGYSVGTRVLALQSKTVIAPFPENFFGSPYSGSWMFPIPIPDVRVASAELFATNDVGNSPTNSIFVTHNDDAGLRTLSGGQYSIQVDGYLAVEDSVAPPLVVERDHAVRDIYGVLGTAADATVQVQVKVNGSDYCTLSLAAGVTVSTAVNGLTVAPLRANDQITVAVTSVGSTYPGAGLNVIVRV